MNTTEIARADAQELTVLPPARPPQAEALGQLMAHAEAMSAAKQLAEVLAGTDMVPRDYKNKPGNAAAAILYGAELGLDPIQSLQQIFVVHGAPAIYARTAVALVKRQGILVETVQTSNEAVTVRATDTRTGQVEQSTWDMPRAELAGYTSNAKYRTNPQEMLYAKAAMEVCRKIAPDVLLGIPYAREELDLEQPPARVRAQRSRGIEALREAQQAAETKAVEAGPAERKVENTGADSARRKWLNRMFDLFGDANLKQRDDQRVVIAELGELDELPEHRDGIDDETLRKVVTALNNMSKAHQGDPDQVPTLEAQIDDVLRRWELRQSADEAQS